MRIAISLLNFRSGRAGSAETYVRALIAHLPDLAGGDEIALITHRDNADAVPADLLQSLGTTCQSMTPVGGTEDEPRNARDQGPLTPVTTVW